MHDKSIFRFYAFTTIGLVVGWLWIWLSVSLPQNTFSACFVKNITGISCPSCGTTHSVRALLEGHWMAALQYNILGYAWAIVMFLLPVLLARDAVARVPHLYRFWQRAEHHLRNRPWQLALLLSPIFMNWFWILYH